MIRTRAWGGARAGVRTGARAGVGPRAEVGPRAGVGPRATTATRAWRAFVFVLPGLWVLGVVAWEMFGPSTAQLVQLLAAAPAIACAGTGRRQCVVLGGLCALFALVPLSSVERDDALGARIGTCAAILAVVAASYLTTGRRVRLLRELERTREIAAATQMVLLRPLPPQLDGLTVAAGHLSATRGAAVGGDLYEALATPYGVRLVIGDVRGHGLTAIGAVAALLGSFREAAHDEPDLGGVLRRLERAMHRHLLERSREEDPATGRRGPECPPAEEFVTVLLLEVDAHGDTVALNCGHPWPYLLSADAAGEAGAVAVPVADADPLPPLGPFPLPAEIRPVHCLPLRPGQALCLHTDGAEEARDAAGEFFPLSHHLAAATGQAAAGRAHTGTAHSATGRAHAGTAPDGATAEPRAVIEDVQDALLRHAGGLLADDVALVVVRNDRLRLPSQPPGGHTGTRPLHSAAD